MKRKKILILTITVILGIVIFKFVKPDRYELTEYDKKLIDYFDDVVLNTEYDNNPQKVLKWTEPMNLFIFKNEKTDSQVKMINNTVNKINELVGDQFKIQLSEDPNKINSVIFLMEKEKAEKLVPSFFTGIDEEIAGLADIEYDSETFEILNAKIFIDINQPIEIHESTILEEITQSIGIMNDSEKYPKSIFYLNKQLDSIRVNEYSKLDKDIIRILYNSRMKPGLNFVQAEKVIKKILME